MSRKMHWNYLCNICGTNNFPYVDEAYFGNARCTCGGMFERSTLDFNQFIEPKKAIIEVFERENRDIELLYYYKKANSQKESEG